MFNSHLLKLEITAQEYRAIAVNRVSLQPEPFLDKLPVYSIARCPFCFEENTERLNTYAMDGWHTGYGSAIFDSRAIVQHCKHFALTQSFFHFQNIWPSEANGMLGPEVPHVIGHLLSSGHCLAVIHALPICRIEDSVFVPRYILFMVSYFSEKPKEAYDAVIGFNVPYVEDGVAWPFISPPKGRENWWNLQEWITQGQLFWVNGNSPSLEISTRDPSNFPYGKITGRTVPYFHTFPYPLPKPRKTKIKAGVK